jgi:hypothetical protein
VSRIEDGAASDRRIAFNEGGIFAGAGRWISRLIFRHSGMRLRSAIADLRRRPGISRFRVRSLCSRPGMTASYLFRRSIGVIVSFARRRVARR